MAGPYSTIGKYEPWVALMAPSEVVSNEWPLLAASENLSHELPCQYHVII